METKKTTCLEADIEYVRSILPTHYTVKESRRFGSIHCKSSIGIRLPSKTVEIRDSVGCIPKMKVVADAEDKEHWFYIMSAIKKHFGFRFQEIEHNTCFCHIDFTIHLRKR